MERVVTLKRIIYFSLMEQISNIHNIHVRRCAVWNGSIMKIDDLKMTNLAPNMQPDISHYQPLQILWI